MTQFLSFVVFAAIVAVAPGPDTFLTMRNTVTGGRRRGLWTMVGIATAGSIQGLLAAAGLGAVIAHAEPVFQTIRWAGVAYLAYLGFSALRAARRSAGADWSIRADRRAVTPWRSLRQGFLCNITNPKVLAFNLAVIPQFAGTHSSVAMLVAYALTLTVVGSVVLLTVVAAAGRARRLLQRPRVQRGVEAGTGVAMLGFAAALATEG